MSDLRIKLCKPDRTTIYNLIDVQEPVYTQIYSGINTLNFDVPYYLTKVTGEKYINPAISLIKQFYLLFYDGEYFIIDFPEKESNEETDVLHVKSYGLGYQLARKKIRNYQTGVVIGDVVKYVMNLTDTATEILANTGWIVGDVDTSLDLLYRAVNIPDSSVLDSINTLCETWNCVPKYNTVTRTIDFVDYKTDGFFQGLVISQGRYLKNINCEKINDLVTKLHVFGVNEISINAVNPNGQNYITDYTFVKNTDYMPQTMIDNLELYETALVDNQSTFEGYLTTKIGYQGTLLTKQNELDVLLNEETYGLNNLNLALDIAIANGVDTTTIKSDIAARQALVDTKNSEIDAVELQIDGVDAQILALQGTLDISNFLSVNEISLLNDLTFEDNMTDSSITTKGTTITILQELLAEAQKQLALLSTPRYSATLDVVDFCNTQNVTIDKDRLVLGSIVKVRHPQLDIFIDAKITEIEQNFDDFGLSIKVANSKDIKSGWTNAQSLLKNVSNTNGVISVGLNNWNQGGTAHSLITDFLENSIDATEHEILSGNNTVSINERGVTIVDSTGQYTQRFTAGAWTLSDGDNITVGASHGVIHGEVIAGEIIVGNLGKFNAIKMYDNESNLICELGEYLSQDGVTQKKGIKIQNSSLEILGGGDGSGYLVLGDAYNNLVIDSVTGITVTRSDNKSRTLINATDGMKIQKSTDGGVNWTDVLYFDTDGNGYFHGNGEFNGTLNASDLQIDGTSILTTIEGLQKIDAQYISGNFSTIEELIVDELSTSDKIRNYLASDTGDVNYIRIYNQNIEYITATYTSGYTQATKADGTTLLYWIDETHTAITLETTDYPVYVYNYTELVKTTWGFVLTGETYTPKFTFGVGDMNGYSKGHIFKGTTGLELDYSKSNTGEMRKIIADDDGIRAVVGDINGVPSYTNASNLRNIIVIESTETASASMGSVNDIIFKKA